MGTEASCNVKRFRRGRGQCYRAGFIHRAQESWKAKGDKGDDGILELMGGGTSFKGSDLGVSKIKQHDCRKVLPSLGRVLRRNLNFLGRKAWHPEVIESFRNDKHSGGITSPALNKRGCDQI